jgi:hypothetical protein
MEYMLGIVSIILGANSSPGRFFAVNEIKLMLAFALLRYDFKTKDGKRPANLEFQGRCIPNPSAEILFRKREGISEQV